MREMMSLPIPFSLNTLKHVQMISRRPDVCSVQHVLRLLHHHAELLIVDLPHILSPSLSLILDLLLSISSDRMVNPNHECRATNDRES